MTQSLKLEIWPVKDFDGDISGYVVTRPIDTGDEYEDQTPIVKSYSKVHSTMQLAIQECRVALDNLEKIYKAQDKK